MPARLSETYWPGAMVEIAMNVDGQERWLAGRVAVVQHPGLWVQLTGGSMWFVTNTRRIRPGSDAGQES